MGSEMCIRDSGKREPLLLELEHFVTCCVNRDRPRTDGRHAVAVAALLDHIDANTTEWAAPVAVETPLHSQELE